MSGWKCALYKRSRGLFAMFGGTFPINILVACSTGDVDEVNWPSFFEAFFGLHLLCLLASSLPC